MINRTIALFIFLSILFPSTLRADEGMWLLPKIGRFNMEAMRQLGINLTAEEIFSNDSPSIKDAVVNIGYIGSGAVVSANGLVITNHHVIYDHIQRLSSSDNDYLTNGFWAASYQEELPAQGLTVSFLRNITDVTREVKAEIAAAQEKGVEVSMRQIGRKIANQFTRGTNLQGDLTAVYNGEMYYLYLYETFNDIRLVGAPPSSIGKFGGDTDNFMWPRHTGDFGFIRVYSSPQGQPAAYSQDNVPYTPHHYLKLDISGIENHDFTMVLGYPGASQRYLSAAQVDDLIQVTHPGRIAARGKGLEIIMEDMMADDEIRLKYASKHFNSSNGYKFSLGQLDQLQRYDARGIKQKDENTFMAWVQAHPGRVQKYGRALEMIQSSVEQKQKSAYAHHLLNESLMMGTDIYVAGIRANVFRNNAGKKAGSRKQLREEVHSRLLGRQQSFFRDYNAPTDKKVVSAMMKLVKEELDQQYLPDIYDYIDQKFGGDIDQFIDKMFATSILVDQQRLEKFARRPKMKILDNDLAVKFSESIYNKAIELRNLNNQLAEGEKTGSRLYLEGLREMQEGKPMYADANFTMRMTYGKVLGYSPKNAVYYKPFSTLKGVVEKHRPEDYEFAAPLDLLDLYQEKDYGKYGTPQGMPLAFLSDNDITGGNSGSPVLNKNGHLIGVAFDGNWESLAGDVVFMPELNRTISVDIRYVLFITDKFAGAQHILKELEIVGQ